MRKTYASVLILIFLSACTNSERKHSHTVHDHLADATVAAYAEQFEGRGDQADDSQPIPPEEVLNAFQFPSDLTLDLVASEPMIIQPVELTFDHRGRLWVVQYSQYPFPAGVKITGYDYHLRAEFDKVPEPPPSGARGADKISVLEDTDGDGILDTATDAITGLNIATSLTWGRGKIWVLNPPYLLSYPDPDGDGIPNGEPRVHLRGFGLEDTHAVANSLRWGPDGWLYGAQGSTCTATISSSVTKNIHFKGQAIWRYHPETEVFEIYAEGGGNTFHVEIDEKGRVYSGHNGAQARGPYYKQGAYYPKNWGKHGPLTNPYAFGYLPHMRLEGEKLRFTHAFIKYEADHLPQRYQGTMIGINPLHNFLQVSTFEPEGSTFRNTDIERVLQTEDHWFRPVDIKAGPEGGVYLADWYDSRLSHIDPRDTWHHSSGRIYRLRAAGERPNIPAFDLSTYSNEELIACFGNPNKWLRQQALRQLGDRKDATLISPLTKLMNESDGQIALEALWALNLSGGFDENKATQALAHRDPYVRMWAVRLLGDQKRISDEMLSQLRILAQTEKNLEVSSQLAASCKRLEGEKVLEIIKALALREDLASDPEIPLQIWWALESKAISQREFVLEMLEDKEIWESSTIQSSLLERLMQRYVLAGGAENYGACTRLLELAPDDTSQKLLINGLSEGLRGRTTVELPSDLASILREQSTQMGESGIAIGLRQGDTIAVRQALDLLSDSQTDKLTRLNIAHILGETATPEALPILLMIIGDLNSSVAMKQASLQALASFDDEEIGNKIIAWYPDRLRAHPQVRRAALDLLATRSAWTLALLQDMDIRKLILATDVPEVVVRQIRMHEVAEIRELADRLWPMIALMKTEEKQNRMDVLSTVLKASQGNASTGKPLFQSICGTCHQLFGEGGIIGPDLTGYERSNPSYLLAHTIDPHAEIREGYVNYRINTKDGRILTGVIVERSGGIIRLRTGGGQMIELSESQIRQLKAQSESIMPEHLLDALTDEQIQDLFAYLMKEE